MSNGAREALIEIALELLQPPFGVQNDLAVLRTDELLAELWLRGFKIVPLDFNARC